MKVAVMGAGGHGRVVIDILFEMKCCGSDLEVLGFIDDDSSLHGKVIGGFKVLGGFQDVPGLMAEVGLDAVALGLEDNRQREKTFLEAKEKGLHVIFAVHPNSVAAHNVTMEDGVVLMAGAVVGPGTVLKKGAVVNTGATVAYDCTIGEFVHIGQGAHLAGAVTVGRLSRVDTGASVIRGVNIGESSIVEAGAAVTGDVPDNSRVSGVPARTVGKPD